MAHNRQITNENQRKTSEKPTKIQRKSSENQRKTNQKLYKSGESGNIQPLPPLLLPPANTLIHNEIVQKVAEVVIKLQKKLVDGRLWAAVSVF